MAASHLFPAWKFTKDTHRHHPRKCAKYASSFVRHLWKNVLDNLCVIRERTPTESAE